MPNMGKCWLPCFNHLLCVCVTRAPKCVQLLLRKYFKQDGIPVIEYMKNDELGKYLQYDICKISYNVYISYI